MAESVYKIVDLVGTSTESWEKAAAAAVARASQTLRDLRIAEVEQLDMQIEEGQVINYRAKGAALVQVRRRRLALTPPSNAISRSANHAVATGDQRV